MAFKQGTCLICGETEMSLWNNQCIECADYKDLDDTQENDMFKRNPAAAAIFSSNHYYPPTTGNPLLKEHTMFKNILPPALLILCLGMGLFVVIRAVVAFTNPMANGIIAIPDWEHGVLICGDNATEEPTSPIKVHAGGDDYGLIWSDAFGTWTVNEGHMSDIQLYKLKSVAKFTCPLNRGGLTASHNHFITNNGYDVSLYGVQDSNEGREEEGFMVTDDQGVQDHTFQCDGDFNVILVKN